MCVSSVECDRGHPRRWYRKDDLVARLETARDFNGVDGALARVSPACGPLRSCRNKFENSDGVVFLAKSRPADINDIVQSFELDGSIDAQIRARAFGQIAVERHVDRDGSLLDRGIDADDVAVHHAVSRVDRRPPG